MMAAELDIGPRMTRLDLKGETRARRGTNRTHTGRKQGVVRVQKRRPAWPMRERGARGPGLRVRGDVQGGQEARHGPGEATGCDVNRASRGDGVEEQTWAQLGT